MLGYLPVTAFAVLCATPALKNALSRWEDVPAVRYGRIALSAVLMLLCVAALASQSYNPFIYFRF